MARGPRRHQKRISAPSHWMLDKLTGVWAPRPSSGPHKIRECLPLIVMLRNRLKYALNYNEAKAICIQRLVKVDGKIRTKHTFPAGFMDSVTLESTGENFRLLYDVKGRFVCHKITEAEAAYKLCRVNNIVKGAKGINHVVTHDGRTIRFPDPAIKVNDSIKLDLETGKIGDFVKFENGNVCMITGGNNVGRVGVLTHREKHPGSFEIAHLKDAADHHFATRLTNVMVIGKGQKPWVSLPKGNGIKLNVIQDRQARMAKSSKD
jgi:small subunit ribosomal protein S4e